MVKINVERRVERDADDHIISWRGAGIIENQVSVRGFQEQIFGMWKFRDDE